MEDICTRENDELLRIAEECPEKVLTYMRDVFLYHLFLLLPEEIRMKGLEDDPELVADITAGLSEDEITEPGWPYLGQSDIQSRCTAEIGCEFALGAALYPAACGKKSHFLCTQHKSRPCRHTILDLEKSKVIAESEAKNPTVQKGVPPKFEVEDIRNVGGGNLEIEETITIHKIKQNGTYFYLCTDDYETKIGGNPKIEHTAKVNGKAKTDGEVGRVDGKAITYGEDGKAKTDDEARGNNGKADMDGEAQSVNEIDRGSESDEVVAEEGMNRMNEVIGDSS